MCVCVYTVIYPRSREIVRYVWRLCWACILYLYSLSVSARYRFSKVNWAPARTPFVLCPRMRADPHRGGRSPRAITLYYTRGRSSVAPRARKTYPHRSLVLYSLLLLLLWLHLVRLAPACLRARARFFFRRPPGDGKNERAARRWFSPGFSPGPARYKRVFDEWAWKNEEW